MLAARRGHACEHSTPALSEAQVRAHAAALVDPAALLAAVTGDSNTYRRRSA